MEGDHEPNDGQGIPSLELRGSRAERLRTLDSLIAHLYKLRGGLADGTSGRLGGFEGAGPYIDAPTWPWFAAGVGLGALFVVLLMVAWSLSGSS